MADFIFDPAVISPETKALYPEGYTMRPLARDDYHRGFLNCLQDLTWTGETTEEQFNERFDWQKTHGKGWYYCVVIVDATDRIVGTGTVVVEKKFIQGLASLGHIEDICIAKDHQGKHFGQKLINTLDAIAAAVGCHQTVLNCSPRNEAFYAKCGYEKAGTEMSHALVLQ